MISSAGLTIEQKQDVSDFIHQRFGLFFPPQRFNDMLRALGKATDESGFDSIVTYVRWLLSRQLSDKQLEPLITNLTIGETYFFRDGSLFSGLKKVVFPEIIQQSGDDKRVRIWSAACSTGEEAYSLAILLDQAGSFPAGWQVDLYATDVNVKSLAKARAAIYSQWSFRGVDKGLKERYFIPCGKHQWQLVESMRTKVQFSYLNLAAHSLMVGTCGSQPFDIILCRNVLMYFSPERRAVIIQKLVDMLSDTGWLIVSPSEVGLVDVSQLRVVEADGMLLHRKGGHGGQCLPTKDVIAHTCSALSRCRKARVFSGALTVPAVIKKGGSALVCVGSEKIKQIRKAKKTTEAKKTTQIYNDDKLAVACSLVEQKDYCAAIKLLLTSLDGDQPLESSTQVKPILLLASCYANVGDIDEAQAWLEKALQLDRLNAPGYYLLATIQQERGELDQVRKSLEQVLYLDPDFIMAIFSLGLLLQRGDENEQGVKLLCRALSLLANMEGDAIVPESEGMTVSHLSQMLTSLI